MTIILQSFTRTSYIIYKKEYKEYCSCKTKHNCCINCNIRFLHISPNIESFPMIWNVQFKKKPSKLQLKSIFYKTEYPKQRSPSIFIEARLD